MHRLLGAAVVLLGAAVAAPALAQAQSGCTAQGAITAGAITVEPCTATSMNDPIVGNLSGYYGQVAMNVGSNGQYRASKDFGRYLRELFGVRDEFDAVVAIELYKDDVLIYQRPLFTASVDKGNGSKIEITTAMAADTDISPIFLLERGKESVKAKIKISTVNKRSGAPLSVVKEGIDAAKSLGGHGWLVTAFTSEAFMKFAARGEAALNQFYSYDHSINTEADLKYGGTASYKSVTYRITLPAPDKKTAAPVINATVFLKAMPSLVTTELTKDPAGVTRPDTHGGTAPNGRWAARILIRDNPELRLGAHIDGGGVPRKLAELRVPEGAKADDVVARRQQIDASCQALRDAVDSGPFRLSDVDRDLVLFDELRLAGVFKVYDASTLTCTQDVVARWKALGITPETPRTETFKITHENKVERLNLLAQHWDFADEATRRQVLPLNFENPVRLTARPDLIEGYPAPTAADGDGLATWDIQPQHLAKLRKSCLGNFKPAPADTVWSTAFAKFEGDPRLYLVRATFLDSRPFGKQGPTISALEVREASKADRDRFDLTGSCLAP